MKWSIKELETLLVRHIGSSCFPRLASKWVTSLNEWMLWRRSSFEMMDPQSPLAALSSSLGSSSSCANVKFFRPRKFAVFQCLGSKARGHKEGKSLNWGSIWRVFSRQEPVMHWMHGAQKLINRNICVRVMVAMQLTSRCLQPSDTAEVSKN